MLLKRTSLTIIITLLSCLHVVAQLSEIDALKAITAEAHPLYLSDPDSALVLTEEALTKAVETKDSFHQAYCYYLFSKAYWVKANYKLSTQYGFMALKLFQNTGHYQQLSATLLGLARTLVELGNMEKAREFIHEALQLAITHGNRRIEADSYREYSFLLAEKNQLDSALYYSDRGLALYQSMGDSLDMSILFGRKSRILFQQKRFHQSKEFAYKALAIDSAVGNRRALGISYYQTAQNESALGNNKKAVQQLKQSIRISSEIGNLYWQMKAHDLLSTLYLAERQPALAALELQAVSKYKDQLYNSEKNGQIQEMQALHLLEDKENQIQILRQENLLRQQETRTQRLFVAFLLTAVLLLTMLAFVLTRLRMIQKKTNRDLASKNLAIEQQRLSIQMQAENLQQLDRLKTKLFSVISHDLRGPISNLQALLDMFENRLMTADEFRALSGTLKENVNLTQKTLENLLAWSLSQMGGIKTQRRHIDITICIEEACSLMKEMAGRKNITLEREATGPLKVWADTDQIQAVLRNLIHNAIKFSPYDSAILITADRDSTQCRTCIKDCGIGMSEHEVEMIMQSGQYLSKDGTDKEKGTGLGLLLCKEFIGRNGGQISIKSTLGLGTEVSFTLELVNQEKSPALAVQD